METQTDQSIVKTNEWVVTLLIAAIPLINIIMLFVWAFGGSTNPNKANWAKASLIWIAIIFGFFLLVITFGGVFLQRYN